jgi:cytidylate kinase
MKIKLKELSDTNNSLMKFLQREMDVKLAYRMRKISGKIVAELKHIDTEIIELRKKHGAKEENRIIQGREIPVMVVPDKNVKDFEKDVDTFLQMEIEFGAEKIPFECLEGMEKISALDLANIEKFIDDQKPSDHKSTGGKK